MQFDTKLPQRERIGIKLGVYLKIAYLRRCVSVGRSENNLGILQKWRYDFRYLPRYFPVYKILVCLSPELTVDAPPSGHKRLVP